MSYIPMLVSMAGGCSTGGACATSWRRSSPDRNSSEPVGANTQQLGVRIAAEQRNLLRYIHSRVLHESQKSSYSCRRVHVRYLLHLLEQ